MKLIKPNVEYISQGEGLEGVDKQIELCGRVCYKSEDKMTATSAHNFVARMIKSSHTAMLEHGTIYLIMKVDHSDGDYIDFEERYSHNPYSRFIVEAGVAYVTTNYRVIVENDWFDDLLYAVNPTEYHLKRYTLKFVCDRGVSHELVRHRVFSFAQESTRYCNYSKDKFNNEITFIRPYWFNNDSYNEVQRGAFIEACGINEDYYLMLLGAWEERKPDKRFRTGFKNNPLTPQQARGVLPNALKTEIVMTGFEDDWRHFFDLRLRGTTGKPHPDMLVLAELAHKILKENVGVEL